VLAELLTDWRTDGLGLDVLQVWLVGFPGTQHLAAGFCSGTDASCFVDGHVSGDSAIAVFNSKKDDLFVLDDANATHHYVSLAVAPLTVAANRTALDTTVRGLLE